MELITDKDPWSGETILQELLAMSLNAMMEKEWSCYWSMEPTLDFKTTKAGCHRMSLVPGKWILREKREASNMTVIYVIFQRVTGDASLSFKM